jgi:hypothetical protein
VSKPIRKTCLQCEARPTAAPNAVRYDRFRPWSPYFCSQRCAALYGTHAAKYGETWCEVHGGWADGNEGCRACALAESVS